MPKHRAYSTEGNNTHDDQRLEVGLQWNREQREDHHHSDGESRQQVAEGFGLTLTFAAHNQLDTKIALPLGLKLANHLATNLIGLHSRSVDIADYGNDAAPIAAINARVTVAKREISHT